MDSTPIDPRRCPLCQKESACGMANGATTCWCFTAKIPESVLARIPDEARGVACVCEACARGETAAAPSGDVVRLRDRDGGVMKRRLPE